MRQAIPLSTVKERLTSEAAALTAIEGSLVILSLFELPVSCASATVGVAIVVSRVKVSVAFAVLPATSVSVTTTVCCPSAVGAM